MKKVVARATKVVVMGEGFQDMGPEEIQVLIDTTPEALTEDNLMEMSALEPVPDDEEEDADEAAPENKLTSDNLAEVFQIFQTALAKK